MVPHGCERPAPEDSRPPQREEPVEGEGVLHLRLRRGLRPPGGGVRRQGGRAQRVLLRCPARPADMLRPRGMLAPSGDRGVQRRRGRHHRGGQHDDGGREPRTRDRVDQLLRQGQGQGAAGDPGPMGAREHALRGIPGRRMDPVQAVRQPPPAGGDLLHGRLHRALHPLRAMRRISSARSDERGTPRPSSYRSASASMASRSPRSAALAYHEAAAS